LAIVAAYAVTAVRWHPLAASRRRRARFRLDFVPGLLLIALAALLVTLQDTADSLKLVFLPSC
jgi:hypothetical protein